MEYPRVIGEALADLHAALERLDAAINAMLCDACAGGEPDPSEHAEGCAYRARMGW